MTDLCGRLTREQIDRIREEYASYLPPPAGTWHRPRWPWEKMEVGDCVFVTSECRCYKSLFNMLNALRKRTGKRFRIFAVNTLKSQWRIWRVV